MTSRRRALAILLAGAAASIGLFVAGQTGGLRINLTPSYALGLWRIVPIERAAAVGDLIFICPPVTHALVLGTERGYMRRGICPGWMSPLLKSVVAGQGQRIQIGDLVTIDGQPLARSEVRTADAQGRALAPWSGGIVPAGHLFLHSEFAGSYDSRYFGPIPADGVLGLARPVLTVDP
ncbi:conjugative transfer signal peptidase TraF [Neoaquamicrobium sediminum]|uniref:conjugative transfer signal peptidase TraF n=1 Tax=Neoaquamicrobium sediminum TaxID=1849104 RepID=UPI00156647FC|nr:conjugative transfer signal peptidase TraF [Mesorhizobium sediminum]NRC57280.1 conjugative transfer signal peptidase TraF [Mesorhizobium sediminum]